MFWKYYQAWNFFRISFQYILEFLKNIRSSKDLLDVSIQVGVSQVLIGSDPFMFFWRHFKSPSVFLKLINCVFKMLRILSINKELENFKSDYVSVHLFTNSLMIFRSRLVIAVATEKEKKKLFLKQEVKCLINEKVVLKYF